MKNRIVVLTFASAAAAAAACAKSASSVTPEPVTQAGHPSPDSRVGLRGGWFDAAQSSWNMQLVSSTKPSAKFLADKPDDRLKNSDLAFVGNYVYQGNYSGWQLWDAADPAHVTLKTAYVCPGSQSDVSVFRNLLFVSAEATTGRTDCGIQGVTDTVSADRARGIRVIDMSDVMNPRYVTTVQTCRGSHTHTVVPDPRDPDNVYIYVSGSAGVRSPHELPGCSDLAPTEDPNSALFRIEVIQVPVAHPEQAHIISSPRIFDSLTAPAKHAESVADSLAQAARRAARGAPPPAAGAGTRAGPNQCHDITVYPAIGLAGGACGGYGLLLDIRDPAHPRRKYAAADSNFSFWHSATFSNDGRKVLFSDEWGGGTQPRCRVTDKPQWGADAIFTIDYNDQLAFRSYFKLPAPQTPEENCVAHNGSLIPVPGRDIMVQAWYQGGADVFDWTDPSHPVEIAYFDRGPVNPAELTSAGYWSAYWYNGHIYGSEIARGIDILDLTPSPMLTQNEIDAAKLVRFDYLNVQAQPKFEWPASFAVSRAYLDQLSRSRGLSQARIDAIAADLHKAEKMLGPDQAEALRALARTLDRDTNGSSDAAKVGLLAESVKKLAAATR
jgi:hypothetical protein